MFSLGPNMPNRKREEEETLIMALWTWDFPFCFCFSFFFNTRTLPSEESIPKSPKCKTNKIAKLEVLSASNGDGEREGLGS